MGPHLNDTKKGAHHIRTSSPELQVLNNYHIKDILLSAMAHLCDDNTAHLPDVEKTLYAATVEAWKEYEATYIPCPKSNGLPSPRNFPTCLRTARRLKTPPT
jgi:hypothetical protein